MELEWLSVVWLIFNTKTVMHQDTVERQLKGAGKAKTTRGRHNTDNSSANISQQITDRLVQSCNHHQHTEIIKPQTTADLSSASTQW